MRDLRGILISVVGTLAAFAIAAFAFYKGVKPADIALLGFIVFGTIIVLFAAGVLYQIGTGMISLSGIISEPREGPSDAEGNPKASLSRFQFLVFTFVVAGLFLMLSIETGKFVHIPDSVLVLIGLSGTGFLVGKATSTMKAPANPEDEIKRKTAEKAKLEQQLKDLDAELKDLSDPDDAKT